MAQWRKGLKVRKFIHFLLSFCYTVLPLCLATMALCRYAVMPLCHFVPVRDNLTYKDATYTNTLSLSTID